MKRGAGNSGVGGGKTETPSDVGQSVLARVALLAGGALVILGVVVVLLWRLSVH